jgi:hypothetical protein
VATINSDITHDFKINGFLPVHFVRRFLWSTISIRMLRVPLRCTLQSRLPYLPPFRGLMKQD